MMKTTDAPLARLVGLATLFLLSASCARVKEAADRNGFIAVSESDWRTVTLDFSHPPDFVLTIEIVGEDGKKERTVEATRPSSSEKREVYRFVRRDAADNGAEAHVTYSYKHATAQSNDLQIWTDIKSVPPENLDYMGIDRAPFCIVVAINEAGIFPIPLNRKDARPEARFQASGPIPFKKDGKWGFRDPSNTRVVVEARFDNVDRFHYGRAEVCVNGKSGFIDTAGRYIAEPNLDEAKPFGEIGDPELAEVSRDDKKGVIDASGKYVVELKYDKLGYRFYDGVIEVELNGKQGYIRKDGKIIVEPIYESVWNFTGGMGAVLTNDGWGFVDTDGKFVIRPQFKRVGMFFDGLSSAQLKTGKWGFIDRTGRFVIEPRFDYAGHFSEGFAAVAMGVNMENWEDHGDASGKWGFIDKTGKVVLDLKYDHVESFHGDGDRTNARLNGVYGYLYKNGRFEPWPEKSQ